MPSFNTKKSCYTKFMPRPKPLLLTILDGFGVNPEQDGNPVAHAKTPTLNFIERNFPFATLQASGVAVGLPWGEAGNSEVGHLTMGAGRVIYHHLPRIIGSIADGSFFENEALKKAAEHVRQNNSNLHIAGLISSGSVHSYIDHLYAVFDLKKKENIKPVFIHICSDGKDAPPKEGAQFLKTLEERIKKDWPYARFASIIGRFYGMDRDENWDRTASAYKLLTQGTSEKITSVSEYLAVVYQKDLTDTFVPPAIVVNDGEEPLAIIQANDALIFSDFREDSMRQIAHAFVDESFDHFAREKIPNLLVVTMTEYEKNLSACAAFPALDIVNPLARVIGEAGLRQLHIAETEKYAHVTYFFNGGVEKPMSGEDRILIASTPTAHFDETPEMKAAEITEKIIANLGQYDVIIANLANTDMVGHSGNFNAAVRAVEVVDESLGKLITAILNADGVMVITADHGNIELKRNMITGEKLTEHSLNPVPCIIIGNDYKLSAPRDEATLTKIKREASGILTDVAPTIIELLELKKPAEMTGKSLLITI